MSFYRTLALDLGEKQIGIAVSDGLKLVASPLETIQRTSRAADFEQIGRLATANQVDEIVIGLPVQMDGQEGALAAWVRDYGSALGAALELPVIFWDESFSTDMAVDALHAQGYSRKKMKESGRLDAVAAAIILQNYLETRDRRLETGE